LDGYKSDPDSRFGLTVRISDPSVKAKRSDEKDAVLFVGGLNAKTTEQDVRDLFKDVSNLYRVIADYSTESFDPKLEARVGCSQGGLQRLCVRHIEFRGTQGRVFIEWS